MAAGPVHANHLPSESLCWRSPLHGGCHCRAQSVHQHFEEYAGIGVHRVAQMHTYLQQ